MRSRLLVGALLALGSIGCRTGSRSSAPEVVARAYLKALAKGDYRRAYGLLGPELRARVGLRRFRANVAALDAAHRKRLAKLASGKLAARKRVILQVDEDRRLVFEERHGRWFLVSDPLAFYPQDTPRQCLESFLRAARRRRYRILMRFVPRKDRRYMKPEDIQRMFQGERGRRFQRILARLEKAKGAPIERRGDRAVLFYGEGARMVFVREEGRWVIESFE